MRASEMISSYSSASLFRLAFPLLHSNTQRSQTAFSVPSLLLLRHTQTQTISSRFCICQDQLNCPSVTFNPSPLTTSPRSRQHTRSLALPRLARTNYRLCQSQRGYCGRARAEKSSAGVLQPLFRSMIADGFIRPVDVDDMDPTTTCQWYKYGHEAPDLRLQLPNSSASLPSR